MCNVLPYHASGTAGHEEIIKEECERLQYSMHTATAEQLRYI